MMLEFIYKMLIGLVVLSVIIIIGLGSIVLFYHSPLVLAIGAILVMAYTIGADIYNGW